MKARAQVLITDANRFSFALRTNLAGNFYTRETISPPLRDLNGVARTTERFIASHPNREQHQPLLPEKIQW